MRSFVKFPANDPSRYHAHQYDESDDEDWRTFRYFGLFSSFCALGFTAVAVSNRQWLVGQGHNVGLWDNCIYNTTQNETHEYCFPEKTNWQCGVIGLLLFAVVFGLLATVLSTFGVCASSIYMKMYYYHSAGEIYFVCAVLSALALVVYPIATEVADDRKTSPLQSYGASYCLAWLADAFFAAAAVCMELDELAHAWCRHRGRHDGVSSTLQHTELYNQHTNYGVGGGGGLSGAGSGGPQGASNSRHVGVAVGLEKV